MGDATIGPTPPEPDLAGVFNLVDDPLIVVDCSGLVVRFNKAAREDIAGLQPGMEFPVLATEAIAFVTFLRLCETISEPIPGSFHVADLGGAIARRQCRGCRLIAGASFAHPLVLIHIHATGADRRFGILAERLFNARRIIDERRRRERDLRTLLKQYEELLAQQKVEALARQLAESERDEILARLYNAGQDERQRLARDLHDHAGQQVVALNLGLSKLARHLDTPQAHAEHEALLGQVQGIVDSLRRVVLELRPPALDEFGFVTALRALVHDWSERIGIPTEFQIVGEERALADEVVITLYRIAQEALTNVAKHGGAVETVAVILRFDADQATLTINDDGNGFAACPEILQHMHSEGRLGLAGMRERLSLVGGALRIVSAPGRGTTVIARTSPDIGGIIG